MERLQPLKPSIKPLENQYYVLDIETRTKDATPESFVFCCLYGSEGAYFFYSVEDIKAELKKRKYRGKYVFAHFAEFDFSGIYGNIYETDPAAMFAGSQLITFTNGNCKFGDSMNLLKSGVAKIGQALGLPKLDSVKVFQELQAGIISDEARTYCERDCEIVWKALREIFEVTGRVRLTIAGCAMAKFRTDYLAKPIFYDREKSDQFFKSYYGGRVEAFKLGPTYSYKYDVNSLYPFIMASIQFPDPSKLKEYSGDWEYFRRYIFGKRQFEGMVCATVIQKDNDFPALPYRKKTKLLFPTGQFTGYWNFNELRTAIELGQIQIIEFHSALYSKAIKSPFLNYVQENYQLRQENSNNFKSLVFKYLLNSLYGKFGQKIKRNRRYFKEIPVQEIRDLKLNGDKFKIIHFSKDRKDGYLETYEIKPPRHGIAVFASYITSAARCHLLRLLHQNRHNRITYCDTDSICVEIPGLKTSTELGGLKLEAEKVTFIRGAKDYDETRPDGTTEKKIKGIPKKAIQDGNSYTFTQFTKTATALRRGIQPGTWHETTKTPTGKYEKREILDGTETRPHKIEIENPEFEIPEFESPEKIIRENWVKIDTADLLRQTGATRKDFAKNKHKAGGCSVDYFAEDMEVLLREFGYFLDFNEIKSIILEIAIK